MTLPITKDMVASWLDVLTSPFDDSTNLQKVLQSVLETLQGVEDDLQDILESYSLETAIGVQLDSIGEIVGEKRFNRNDTDYRKGIKIKIAINNSEGTGDECLSILKDLSGATYVDITENYTLTNGSPASVSFIIATDEENLNINFQETMQKVVCIGVRVDGVLWIPSTDYYFIPEPSTISNEYPDNAVLGELASTDPDDLLFGVLAELV